MMIDEEPLDSSRDWVAEHARRYAATGGAEGHLWHGVPTLALTTRGRRSGKPRRTMLIYGRDGDRYVVVASNGGSVQHPLWYLNLREQPEVLLQVGPEQFPARARPATAEERPRLWPLMTAIWPDYDVYQTKTAREIPVVVLDRV
jgi:deazaflavin-dependent oxidoreductase (nitroreductase family)